MNLNETLLKVQQEQADLQQQLLSFVNQSQVHKSVDTSPVNSINNSAQSVQLGNTTDIAKVSDNVPTMDASSLWLIGENDDLWLS